MNGQLMTFFYCSQYTKMTAEQWAVRWEIIWHWILWECSMNSIRVEKLLLLCIWTTIQSSHFQLNRTIIILHNCSFVHWQNFINKYNNWMVFLEGPFHCVKQNRMGSAIVEKKRWGVYCRDHSCKFEWEMNTNYLKGINCTVTTRATEEEHLCC